MRLRPKRSPSLPPSRIRSRRLARGEWRTARHPSHHLGEAPDAASARLKRRHADTETDAYGAQGVLPAIRLGGETRPGRGFRMWRQEYGVCSYSLLSLAAPWCSCHAADRRRGRRRRRPVRRARPVPRPRTVWPYGAMGARTASATACQARQAGFPSPARHQLRPAPAPRSTTCVTECLERSRPLGRASGRTAVHSSAGWRRIVAAGTQVSRTSMKEAPCQPVELVGRCGRGVRSRAAQRAAQAPAGTSIRQRGARSPIRAARTAEPQRPPT